ncbi:kinesin-related protein 4 isoform X2 [Episyrphus balteatus]|uniref:kinesin-related protein 4 isoform X2 n=1 Tax=Episyrphus balteatus TaxID=286459 RepID=UPI002484E4FE|nr:kinesin-related protein 4 isoform X2 [Episyrphus balteatus]
MAASNIQVAIKVRPIEPNQASKWEVAGNSIKLVDGGGPEPFYFDHIFDQDASNQVIFDTIAKQIVAAGVKGFNGTIFAYGQTSSGKTYTMMGDEQNPGVMVLAAKKIFREIEHSTDWQFLLRVSYIEIYNEKIHDLLNKNNTDLKIHETSNGEVAVNCSENIITCEQDLLVYLREGSKQRRIGETHMNERSSRSHAIFRIIIESRKIDQTDEDSVQISILNLVDLAGSERADQTGATGSRLKEGGHINKSLLFLSRVIKQLAEAKYVSYRDSKLTRILQASLGGNALTAIICTINPTAVEETLSTLSFANRAKVVKNKPQVNEVVSDSAMMKRLVKKIDALTTELEVEKTKNSQIKVTQLQKLLNDEIHKIINSNSLCSLKASNRNRRRTWCPSSMIPTLAEETTTKTETCIPPLPFAAQAPTKLQLPKSGFNFTPHITVRDVYYQEKLKEIECSPSIDEEFIPGEDVCFDDALTPRTSPNKLGFQTPKNSDFQLRTSLTPKLTEKQRCQELESKVKDLEESSDRSLTRINRYEKEVTDLKDKINQLEMENRTAVGLEFEFQQHKNKSKRRETELLEALEEKRKEISKLERSLQTVTNDMLNNSKEEIQQISRSLNETEGTCTNCKDFQRLLASKQQLIEDFEKANLDNQTLHANIEKITADAESAKLKADYLETENSSLKKDIENLTSLHGTVETIQEQIGVLQLEKCKLESVKIEFEVMSKETANKIAEKINITQEIQNLNTQRDNLAAECSKLQAEIASTTCTKEELEKIRTENESLNLELQKIKTKLETTEQEHINLMAENQSKSDSFKKLNMEVIAARNQLQALQGEYVDIQNKYEHIQAECNKHEGTIGEIQFEYESIQNKYQSLQKEYEKLENDSVQSFADCDRVQTQNENLETEIRELKIKVEEAQRKLMENDSLQLELESLKSEMNRLQGEYQNNVTTSKDTDEVSNLKAENAKIKEEFNSLQLRFNEMQKEYDDISTQLVDNFADYETLQAEMESLQAEFDRFKSSAAIENPSEDFESIKKKSEKLEADNNELLKENAEWKNTVMSMTKSMSEKCDESEQLVAQLQEVKNESIRSDSPRRSLEDCMQFIHMANSFLEIEVALGNGETKIFKSIGFNKCLHGTRLIIGNITDITQGTFNELRGAIQFAISTDIHKLSNEIFDSLEMEKHTASPNSCDSLEVPCSRPHDEAQFNELLEEKSKLFESVRELQETVSILKLGTIELANTRKELEDTQILVEQLNSEKLHLSAICEENKCKISELSEIISRAESDNMKLIADCEELKKTVESEGTMENVSRESYEELKQQLEEMSRKVQDNECVNCADLREQISDLKAMSSSNGATFEDLKESKCTNCEEYLSKISKLEAFVGEKFASVPETNGVQPHDKESANETINEHVAMNGGELEEHNGSIDEDKTLKYEKEIANLMEELKTEKSKYQEVQNQINDLRIKFEEQNQESGKSTTNQIEDINSRFTKLQVEYDELLSFERMKSTELEESTLRLDTLTKECKHLQETVAGLKESLTLIEDERNNILHEKKSFEEINNDLNEKIKTLEKDAVVTLEEKNLALEKSSILEKEKEEIVEECKNLKKLIEDHTSNLENKDQEGEDYEKLKEELEQNTKEKTILQEKFDSLNDELIKISAEKQHLQNEFENLKEQQESLKEIHTKERQMLQEKASSLSKQIDELTDDKKQLESTIEKEKAHSKFLFNLGKTADEQLNLEISKARNSNSCLMQEINELKEKLESTENNLTVALEKLNSEKDQIKDDLTSSNNMLLEKVSELECTCNLLKQELADAKESLVTEVGLKEALEIEFKVKEDLLAELSNTNSLLSTKCSELEEKCIVLEKQIGETQQIVSDRKHQLESSQKECSQKEEVISDLSTKNENLVTKITLLEEKLATLEQEFEKSKEDLSEQSSKKDDLITQLSNDNSSLAAKSSEFENKLTALKNQFDESKRDLSEDVRMKMEESLKKEELIAELTLKNSSLAAKSSEFEGKLLILEKQFEEYKRELSEDIRLKVEESSKKDEIIKELTTKATKSSELECQLSILEKSKQDLSEDVRIKIEELSKKDDLIKELSIKNSSLANNSTELEEKLSLLEEQFEESKHLREVAEKNKLDLSEDIRIKIEESSKKDEVIAELSIENNSLTTKSSDLEEKLTFLEKQFEDSKRCLATEVHLKEVLEKANTERDDLIVQLTNNNNSLVTKSSELEEKLAILGNQFEESKRHFSSEVNRLNKILAETNASSTAQSSKIDDLMQKIKSFENEIQIAQQTTQERDSLLQKIDQFQEDYDSLALKNANLEMTKSTFEAELNSAREVVVENTNLIKKINELQNSLKEIQLKCDSLKSSNAELELANKTLTNELKVAIQQAEECNRLRSEILTLQEEVTNEKKLKSQFNNELLNNLKEWESKEALFSNQISQLQTDISKLALEKESIQMEFEELVKSSSDKIVQLEQQVQSLQKDQCMNTSKSSISPKKEKGMEHWMSENHQLKIKNMSLMDKLDSNQKSSPNEERKNRRLSTHDERRMNSFWDTNRDVSTMTDPTNTECSCSEMNEKLNELKQRLLIRDSQVNTLQMEIKNHPLKTENATLKKLLMEEESKQQEMRKEIKKYKSLIVNRTNESRHCAKCAELEKKIFVDSCIQTNDSDESECYRKLLSKYEDLKMICRVRHTKIRELEDALSKGKENANNDNISSLHNQQYRQKYEQLKKELNLVQKKYEEAKILCNMRYEQIQTLSNQQSTNS